MSANQKLSVKQKRFIELYDGDGVKAVLSAGYKCKTRMSAQVIASRLLANPRITEHIKSRETQRLVEGIATRIERQKVWTKIMYDNKAPLAQRLKASELLGKSEGDFTDNHKHQIDGPKSGMLVIKWQD